MRSWPSRNAVAPSSKIRKIADATPQAIPTRVPRTIHSRSARARRVIVKGATHRFSEVLRSGNHAKIAEWRRERSEKDTRERRSDLWQAWQDRT